MLSSRYFSNASGVNGIDKELIAEHHSLGRVVPPDHVLTLVLTEKEEVNHLLPFGSRRNVGLVPELSREYRSGYCETRSDTHRRCIDAPR
jgi:hypothetical protein